VTFATQITILRILLTPVFLALAIYYARSRAAGAPQEWMHQAAVAVFAVAALSDAIDGWVARRFRQESRLGRILDPIADKLLIVASVLMLTLSSWPAPLPLWFVMIVLTREVLTILGTYVVDHVTGTVTIQPHWTGKLATVLVFTTIGTSLLHLDKLVGWMASVATVFTLYSGVIYLADGARQVKGAPGHTPGHGSGPAARS
jgi:cardiolipin synthase (CMP-forming)